MQNELDALTELNLQIGIAESAGDTNSLESLLAPVLAFRRANGYIDDRKRFLDKAAPSASRETTIQSINVVGRERALVTCVVSMGDGDQKKSFHNLRLFVRVDGDWKLLSWANEPV